MPISTFWLIYFFLLFFYKLWDRNFRLAFNGYSMLTIQPAVKSLSLNQIYMHIPGSIIFVFFVLWNVQTSPPCKSMRHFVLSLDIEILSFALIIFNLINVP